MAYAYNQPTAYGSGNHMMHQQQPQQQQPGMNFGMMNPEMMNQFMAMQAALKGGKTPSAATPAAGAKKKYVQRKDRPDINIRLIKSGGLDYDYRNFDINKLKFTIPEAKLINPDDPSKGSARRGEVLYNYGTVEVPNWKPFKLEGPLEVFRYGVGERDKTEKVDGVERPTGEKQWSVCSYMDKNDEAHQEYQKVLNQVYVAFCRWCYFEPKCGMKSMVDVNSIDFSVFYHDNPCTNVKSLVSPEKDKTPEKNIIVGGQPRLYSKCNPYGEWRCMFTDSSDPPVEIDLDVINASITHGWALRSYSTYSIQGQGPSASIADRFQSMVVDHLEEKGRTHQQSGRIRSMQEQGNQKNLELKDQVALIRANMQMQKKQADDLKKQASDIDGKSEQVQPRGELTDASSTQPTNMSLEPTGRGSFSNSSYGGQDASVPSASSFQPNYTARDPIGQDLAGQQFGQAPGQPNFTTRDPTGQNQSQPNFTARDPTGQNQGQFGQASSQPNFTARDPIGQNQGPQYNYNQTARGGAFYGDGSSGVPPATPAVPVSAPDTSMQVNSFSNSNTGNTIHYTAQQQEYYAKMATAQQNAQQNSNVPHF